MSNDYAIERALLESLLGKADRHKGRWVRANIDCFWQRYGNLSVAHSETFSAPHNVIYTTDDVGLAGWLISWHTLIDATTWPPRSFAEIIEILRDPKWRAKLHLPPLPDDSSSSTSS